MGKLAGLGECQLAVGDALGCCSWCGTKLTGRQRRWCTEHPMAWAREHVWTYARPEAVKRDGSACVICQQRGGYDMVTKVWTSLEVNHIAPRRGEGYKPGCWNHQANLETLCHLHHLDVTAAQREHRWTRSARELELVDGCLLVPAMARQRLR